MSETQMSLKRVRMGTNMEPMKITVARRAWRKRGEGSPAEKVMIGLEQRAVVRVHRH
jgi:hypothetical protein